MISIDLWKGLDSRTYLHNSAPIGSCKTSLEEIKDEKLTYVTHCIPATPFLLAPKNDDLSYKD